MAMRPTLELLLLAVYFSLWTEPCSGQSKIPLTQNLTFAAIRLWSNTPKTTNQGRVELQLLNEVWGTICPASWNDTVTSRNVNTTCAMLGFRNGGKRVSNIYGDGSKNFLIENATCPVNATTWYQCTQYFVKKCGPQDEELAVECALDSNGANFVQLAKISSLPGSGGLPFINAPVNTIILNGTNTTTCTAGTNARLIGGDVINTTTGNGYVQVKVNNQWGFVCSDSWNQAAAIVVCRELCYESVPGFTPLPGVIAHSIPDPLTRNFVLSSVNCVGNETSLLSCPVTNASAVCSPDSILAGVQCRPDCCDEKPIVMPNVNCSTEVLIANFTKTRFPLITVNNLFMVNDVPQQCMNVSSNSAGDVMVMVSVASGCGVDLQQNTTHITYAVSVRLVWLSGTLVINAYTNIRYELVCSVPKTYVVTNRMEPYTLAPNLTIYQQYNFSLTMDLFTNCNFTSALDSVGSVYLMEVGQWMNVALSVDNFDTRTKLVLTDCDAYPVVPYSAYTPVVKLIQDKCPVDATLTVYPLDNRREGFQVKAFMFAGYSMVYIRCSVNICLLNVTSADCDRACSKPLTGRRKRSTSNLGTASVDTKTIFLYNPDETGFSKLLGMLTQNPQPQADSGAAGTQNVETETSTAEQNLQQVTNGDQTDSSTAVTVTQQTEMLFTSTEKAENSPASKGQQAKETTPESGQYTNQPTTSTKQDVPRKPVIDDTTAMPEITSSSSKKVADWTPLVIPQHPQAAQAEDQQLNNQPEEQLYEDPKQDQPTTEKQPKSEEGNSSSQEIAQHGVVSELRGNKPGGASIVRLSSVIKTSTFFVWLVYLLSGTGTCQYLMT